MRGRAAAGAIVALVLAFAAPAYGAVQPYGTNDAGGFRNVLPPGEQGTDNALELGQFEALGKRPKHWDDQQSLYQGLLYASPTLVHSDIGRFYKDATFGVKPGDVERTESPRPGVTIVRDNWGVPHVYGTTRGDVEFGAGYAGAEDRLFLMDILRHTGRAELSSFIGGAAGNRQMDRTQWSIAPYTEADLQSQIDMAPTVYGSLGTQLVSDLHEFVAGINAYIAATKTDVTKLPSEYAALGTLPQPWTGTDVIAEASLIGGIFGKGGGLELRSAMLLKSLEKKFGRRRGRASWRDFREKDDRQTANTVLHKRFPYELGKALSKRGLAIPDRGSVSFTPPAGSVGTSATSDGSVGARLFRSLSAPHASNWEMVSARRSRTGHPIGVLGPQVGYYVPEILMEEDLHGPGFDARGATFPGVNLMVQLGHGRDYAWSATTAGSDNVDTFAEVLCGDDFHYMWKGKCRAMEKLTRNNSWHSNLVDSTPDGSETLTVYRTVHGIVYARGRVHGKKVAFATARTTYFHEADSSIGLDRLNDPSFVHDPESFRRAVDGINFAFNWGYIDSKHIAYQLSGWYPRRARGTSPDFPILGTGRYDWRGYDPARHTLSTVALNKRPHAVDQTYLVSWNNKQAPGWAASDAEFAYGPLQRQQMIADHVRHDLAGGRKMGLEQLVQSMEEAATEDIRVRDLKILLKALGRPKDARLKNAIAILKRWRSAGAHRRDLDKNGRYDDDDAVTLMDAFWPRLLSAEFGRVLGPTNTSRLRDMLATGDNGVGGHTASPPDFYSGWWNYVNKDLRKLFGRKRVRGWSRVYCGRGSRKRCRKAVRKALLDAMGMSRKNLYGHASDCESNAQAFCFDMNRFTVAAAIDVPDFPLQNRPTFQQTVELTRSVPR
ncbi:MAG: penicillin acylase family protein [Thermoleophilaceae bacterium]